MLEVGDPAPPLAAKTLDGRPVKLEDYRGKYVLLDFWATWCGAVPRRDPRPQGGLRGVRQGRAVRDDRPEPGRGGRRPAEARGRAGHPLGRRCSSASWPGPGRRGLTGSRRSRRSSSSGPTARSSPRTCGASRSKRSWPRPSARVEHRRRGARPAAVTAEPGDPAPPTRTEDSSVCSSHPGPRPALGHGDASHSRACPKNIGAVPRGLLQGGISPRGGRAMYPMPAQNPAMRGGPGTRDIAGGASPVGFCVT